MKPSKHIEGKKKLRIQDGKREKYCGSFEEDNHLVGESPDSYKIKVAAVALNKTNIFTKYKVRIMRGIMGANVGIIGIKLGNK